MTNSWTPPPYAGGQPFSPPPGGQAPPPRRGGRVVALVAGAVALVAATAGITWAVMRSGPTVERSAGAQASAADQDAAKRTVCETLDTAVRGQPGKGAVRLPDGQLNVPVAFRLLNGAVAIEDVLSPAVPAEVEQAARDYIHAALRVTTAAAGETGVEELQDLNEKTTSALDRFIAVCGLH